MDNPWTNLLKAWTNLSKTWTNLSRAWIGGRASAIAGEDELQEGNVAQKKWTALTWTYKLFQAEIARFLNRFIKPSNRS